MKLSHVAVPLALVLSLAAGAATAQTYPNRPITLIVPFAAGGATDSIARILSEPLSQDLGQQIVIETVGGAGGMIGSARAARAAPDGQTLLFAPTSFGTSPALMAHLPYDPLRASRRCPCWPRAHSHSRSTHRCPRHRLPSSSRWRSAVPASSTTPRRALACFSIFRWNSPRSALASTPRTCRIARQDNRSPTWRRLPRSPRPGCCLGYG